MDEAQIGMLGNRMRDVYADVATAPEEDAVTVKQPSRRLRKNRYVTRVASDAPRSATPEGIGTSLRGIITKRPVTSLLMVAGAGFLLARLSR